MFRTCRIGIRWWWRRSHPRSRAGVLISIGYLLIMIITVLLRFDAFLKLELNALGDFLAGTFAPLALLWLVIGYFQQGEELRQNSRALLMQAEELRQAAAHAGGLLDVARREHELAMEKLRAEQRASELAAERQAHERERQAQAQERRRKDNLQPRLRFDLAFLEESGIARVKLTNGGHGCHDFSLEIPDNTVLRLVKPVNVEKLDAHAVHFFAVVAHMRLRTTPVIAHWTDIEGDRSQREFIASVADKQIHFNESTYTQASAPSTVRN